MTKILVYGLKLVYILMLAIYINDTFFLSGIALLTSISFIVKLHYYKTYDIYIDHILSIGIPLTYLWHSPDIIIFTLLIFNIILMFLIYFNIYSTSILNVICVLIGIKYFHTMILCILPSIIATYIILISRLHNKHIEYKLMKNVVTEHNQYIHQISLCLQILKRKPKELHELLKYMTFADIQKYIQANIESLQKKQFTIKFNDITNTINTFSKKDNVSIYTNNNICMFNDDILKHTMNQLIEIPTYHKAIISSNQNITILKFVYDFNIHELREEDISDINDLSKILSYLGAKMIFHRQNIIIEIKHNLEEVNIESIFVTMLKNLNNKINAKYMAERGKLLQKLKNQNIPDSIICDILSCDQEYININHTNKNNR